MRIVQARLIMLVVPIIALACGTDDDVSSPPSARVVTSPAASTETLTTKPTPEATLRPVRPDIRATSLTIPRLDIGLNIDAPVLTSEVVPDVHVPPQGCPSGPQDSSTVSVPDHGIATPAEDLAGLGKKIWIYGHSRWLGSPGIFFALQDIIVGDDVLIDGIDRNTGEPVGGQRYVVDALYLTDLDSGGVLLNEQRPEDIATGPPVVLQTSVREDGHGKPWILDRGKLLAKSTNLVQGDLDDPCKYLLLFVFATAS